MQAARFKILHATGAQTEQPQADLSPTVARAPLQGPHQSWKCKVQGCRLTRDGDVGGEPEQCAPVLISEPGLGVRTISSLVSCAFREGITAPLHTHSLISFLVRDHTECDKAPLWVSSFAHTTWWMGLRRSESGGLHWVQLGHRSAFHGDCVFV